MNNAMGAVNATALGKTIGRVLQAQELLAIFKGALDWPSGKRSQEDLPRRPIQLGTIEHVIGAFPFQVRVGDDGQE